MKAFGRQDWDAAGAMFRKALDTSLKNINPDGRGTIAARIDGLPADIGVTPAMKQWAHEIRVLGNDATHEEEPFDMAECARLREFTEILLTYVFTMPGRLAERRAATA